MCADRPALGYALRGELGRGAFGVVYEALTPAGESVAVKLLASLRPADFADLKREFRALAGLWHTNVVRVHELTYVDGQPAIVMERVHGADLMTWLCGRSAHDAFSTAELFQRDSAGASTEPAPASLEHEPPPPIRVDRLAAALPQLAAGLGAIHEAGWVHGDLKPTNVLVTDDGRLVILDLGLATPVRGALRRVGTPAFTAPEVLGGAPPTRAADLYALGATLYAVLSGRSPFLGTRAEVTRDKLEGAPAPLLSVAPSCPPAVAALVMELLAPDPRRRPSLADVAAASLRLAATAESLPPVAPRAAVFVGRAIELAWLAEQLHPPRSPTRVLAVRGPSGIGKTALIDAALTRLERSEGALVLRTRCYSGDRLPFRAIEPALDELVARAPELVAAAAADVAGAARIFPSLTPLVSVTDEGRPDAEQERAHRPRAFEHTRALFAEVAAGRRVVLWLDDMQWCDPDSADLLSFILATPDAPGLSIVLSGRANPEERPEHGLTRVAPQATLTVGPLLPEDALQLVALVAGRSPDDPIARRIAGESQGVPYLIELLTGPLPEAPSEGPPEEPIDAPEAAVRELLEARLARLEPSARTALGVLSVAACPLPLSVWWRAARCVEPPLALLERLVRARYVQVVTGGRDPLVVPAHERVLVASSRALDDAARRELHGRLADASASQVSPDEPFVVEQLVMAGRRAEAQARAPAAAAQAAQRLGYEKGAELLATALRAPDLEPARRATLLAERGRMLALAGDGRLAADTYLMAAGLAGSTVERERLEGLAALAMVDAGYYREAADLTRRVLARSGVRLPASELRALPRLLVARARLIGRVDRCEPPSPSSPASSSAALALAEAFAHGTLGTLYPLRGTLLHTHCLEEALEAGDTRLGAMCLAREADIVAMRDPRRIQRGRALLTRARVWAGASGDVEPRVALRLLAAEALLEQFDHRVEAAVSACDRGESLLATTPVEGECERVIFTSVRGFSLYHAGRLREAVQAVRDRVAQAARTGSVLGQFGPQRGLFVLERLMADDPDGALAAIDEHRERWRRHVPDLTFCDLSFLQWSARAYLYRGGREGAVSWARDFTRVVRSGALGLHIGGVDLRAARASMAVERALALRGPMRLIWLARALGHAAVLLATPGDDAAGKGLLVRAMVEALAGRKRRAARDLEAARDHFWRAEMGLWVGACDFSAGRLAGGAGGRARSEEACRRLTREGVVAPERFYAGYAPAFRAPVGR